MDKKVKDILEMALYKFFEKLVRILPIKIRYFIAEKLGILAYFLSKKRRKITLKNLKIAFPEKNIKDLKKIALESYKNIGKNLFEMFWEKPIAKKENIYNFEKLKELYERNKGVIIVTLHFGNWEVSSEFFGLFGYPVFAVAKKQRNILFNEMINKKREKNGIKIIQMGKNSGKDLLKALKSKSILVLGADQYSDDIEVTFFGRKTGAVAGPAVLARKFDAPVIFAYEIRDKNNNHYYYIDNEIIFEKTDNENLDIKNNIQKCINEMENVIKRYPDQWFWQHRRWRE